MGYGQADKKAKGVFMWVRNHWRPSVNSIYQGSSKPGRGASFCFVHDASLAEFSSSFSPVMCWDNSITRLPSGIMKH